jgi:hypothetical protein
MSMGVEINDLQQATRAFFGLRLADVRLPVFWSKKRLRVLRSQELPRLPSLDGLRALSIAVAFVAFVAALGSHYSIEKPFQGPRYRSRQPLPAAAVQEESA